MGRRLSFLLVAVAVLVGAATSVAAATVSAPRPQAQAARCPTGSKRAVIGGNLHDGTAAIAADGTFKLDFDYTSSVGGDPSKGHFTLTGKFSGGSWTGTLEDKVSFTDEGTAYSCGSGTQTWTASKAS